MTDEAILGSARPSKRPPQSTPEQRTQARLARQAIILAWPPVRQPHAEDRQYLRDILHKHGISHVPPEAEPATVKRLGQLIRRTGLTISQAEEAVGMRLPKLIEANPGHALWWLLATTLEAT
jgi:hypothetical protein